MRVHPRERVLRRTADDTDPVERIIVANADQLVIVTALADPEPRPRMIDRCLVAAFEAGLTPVLCLTKSDLADPADCWPAISRWGSSRSRPMRRARARKARKTVITGDHQDDDGLDAAARVLADKCRVLVGHSGVGKSTLVNALVPAADRVVGVVNDVTGRGRHTSTSAVALRLPPIAIEVVAGAEVEAGIGAQVGVEAVAARGATAASTPEAALEARASTQTAALDPDGAVEVEELPGGWVIDTPGVRSFGLAHVAPDAVVDAFPDLAAITAECPRGCTHMADSPDCLLDEFPVDPARLDSLRRLLTALTSGD